MPRGTADNAKWLGVLAPQFVRFAGEGKMAARSMPSIRAWGAPVLLLAQEAVVGRESRREVARSATLWQEGPGGMPSAPLRQVQAVADPFGSAIHLARGFHRKLTMAS